MSGAARQQQVRVRPAPLYERVWLLLRMRKVLGISDAVWVLADAGSAAAGQRRVWRSAQRYLRALFCAGYVGRRVDSVDARVVRYALLGDTGPKAPVFQSGAGVVADPNTGDIHECVR